MKFMVMVNGKYMVSVEAETACGAEHKILDTFADAINLYGVIDGAQAFTAEEMKTNYFITCLLSCEPMSFDELTREVDKLTDLHGVAAEAGEKLVHDTEDLEDMEATFEAVKKDWEARIREARRAVCERKATLQRATAAIAAQRKKLNVR